MAILLLRSFLKNESNFFHKSKHIIQCFQVHFCGNHAHVDIIKNNYNFTPSRLYFYTILTLMTSQMAILLQSAILKRQSNFVYNSLHIKGGFQMQFYGNQAHVGRIKNDFTPLSLYFYTILTLMTSQMAILLSSAILKNESNSFHISICICITRCCKKHRMHIFINNQFTNSTGREARPVAGEKNIFLWRRKGESETNKCQKLC